MVMLMSALLFFSVFGNHCSGIETDKLIGNSIDIFANYGDLSQSIQVISYGKDEDTSDENNNDVFKEDSLQIFENVRRKFKKGGATTRPHITLCDTVEDLMDAYYTNIDIEGTKKPWKAFMGDWTPESLLHTFGLSHDEDESNNCCFFLLKTTKINGTYELDNVKDLAPLKYIENSISTADFKDTSQIMKFIRSYGSHYVSSYTTGDFFYQVIKYKKELYTKLKTYMLRPPTKRRSLRYILRSSFTPFHISEIGDLKVASSNSDTEDLAKDIMLACDRNTSMHEFLYDSILIDKIKEVYKEQVKLETKIVNGDKIVEVWPNDDNIYKLDQKKKSSLLQFAHNHEIMKKLRHIRESGHRSPEPENINDIVQRQRAGGQLRRETSK